MSLPSSATLSSSPRILILASVALLVVAGVFGSLNVAKVKNLRSHLADAVTSRESADHRRAAAEKEFKAREAALTAEKAKIGEKTTPDTEAQIAKADAEKAELQGRIQANEAEIATLRKQLEEKQPASANPGAPTSDELQAQLDEARHQLDSAEREKGFLSDKLQSLQQRSSQLEDEKKRRAVASGKIGVRGTVLAVNQAYNFVVLNLGGRQGVEPHSEMLVVRDGTFIGKIRISSVEPATAIGDIITSSLARGVQVQPGDIVIYAGSNS
jgi:FtsZ-interacting cell division protein ZipA